MKSLVDELLEEQRSLTAVERFSQKHADHAGPALESVYRDLIPIRKPATGEQYAFAVDLDACTGCKACVVACHAMNGLHEEESWRDVGLIVDPVSDPLDEPPPASRETAPRPAATPRSTQQQTVTTACHHCLDPGCLLGCPVEAYEKDPDSGIVRHLDDQCIGCQYCQLKCPYDVPKYDQSLGIVRKCDMCHDRLAEGEAPACVQSCPNGAIRIELISVEDMRRRNSTGEGIVAGAFRSDYTQPTTSFTSARFDAAKMARMRAADERTLAPACPHLPLVTMLTLTQAAVGLSLVMLAAAFGLVPPVWQGPVGLIAVGLGSAGLIASFSHLGSPRGAWRAFLGLKTSWLSREIMLFGAWMPLLVVATALAWLPPLATAEFVPAGIRPPLVAVADWLAARPLLATLPASGAVGLGLLSVFSSVMVYVDTRRSFWTPGPTACRFFGTVTSVAAVAFAAASGFDPSGPPALRAVLLAVAVLLAKLAFEAGRLQPARETEWSDARKSALLQLGPLRRWLLLRAGFALGALICLATLPAFDGPLAAVAGLLALVYTLAGEWCERRLFFQAVVTLKMPGQFRP